MTNNKPLIKMLDLHNDLLTSTVRVDKSNYIKNNQKSGYRSIYALFKGEKRLTETLDLYQKAKHLGVKYFAIEDCCYLTDESADNEAIAALFDKIITINPLYVSLCWNNQNAFAFGAYSEENMGLKSAGVKFIEKLNSKNIAVDTAHINKFGFYELIEIANKLLCSHTAFDFVYSHRRNIDERQIDALIKKGGIIGLNSVGYFLTNNRQNTKIALNAFFKNVDIFIQKYGINSLCLASDFFGSDYFAFEQNYQKVYELICDFFVKRGYSELAAHNFLYKNAIKFFQIERDFC